MLPFIYKKDFIKDSNLIFESLWTELDWERRSDAPRREYWTNTLGRDYTYGHGRGCRTYSPRISHSSIELVSKHLENLLGFRYEACFLNGYENERDGLGWHADDDPNIDHTRPISVVTVGAGRAIQTKSKGSNDVSEVFLEPGSLFLMNAGMQDTHVHRIPKASFRANPRISLTFRGLIKPL